MNTEHYLTGYYSGKNVDNTANTVFLGIAECRHCYSKHSWKPMKAITNMIKAFTCVYAT